MVGLGFGFGLEGDVVEGYAHYMGFEEGQV